MRTIYNLFVLSALLGIGAHSVTANVEPTCGEPPYNKRKDRAVFLWRKCFSSQWYLEAAGGRQPVNVTANLVADTSDIAISNKAVGVELNKDFTINVPRKKKDGFNFVVKDDGSGCLSIKTPEDIPLYVGKNRVELATKSLSVPGFKPCDGPILEYRFDSYNTIYKDTGSNGWDGVRVGGRSGIGYTNLGHSKYGASLDGRRNNMIISEAKDLKMDKYSMMAWVRYTETTNAVNSYVIAQKTGVLWFTINKDTRAARFGGFFGGCARKNKVAVKGTKVIPTESWTHIAATNDGATLKLYINGELDGEVDIGNKGPYCSNQAPFSIGSLVGETRSDDRDFFRGQMDTVRIYDKDLSQDEIRSEMFRH